MIQTRVGRGFAVCFALAPIATPQTPTLMPTHALLARQAMRQLNSLKGERGAAFSADFLAETKANRAGRGCCGGAPDVDLRLAAETPRAVGSQRLHDQVQSLAVQPCRFAMRFRRFPLSTGRRILTTIVRDCFIDPPECNCCKYCNTS